MDKLERSVLRQLLRYGRSKHKDVLKAINLGEIGLGNVTPQQRISSLELSNVVKKACREGKDGALEDALKLIRAFNEKAAEFDSSDRIRVGNSLDSVIKHRVFRVGDVVMHTETGTRCVVVGWKVDEASGEQYLSLLVDQLDAHELLRAGHPLLSQPSLNPEGDDEGSTNGSGLPGWMVAVENSTGEDDEDGEITVSIDLEELSDSLAQSDRENIDSARDLQEDTRKRAKSFGGILASEFSLVTDPALQRISNETRSPSLYFDRFDSVTGCFIPGPQLSHRYPRDIRPAHEETIDVLNKRLTLEKERACVMKALSYSATEVSAELQQVLDDHGLRELAATVGVEAQKGSVHTRADDPHAAQSCATASASPEEIAVSVLEDVVAKSNELKRAIDQLNTAIHAQKEYTARLEALIGRIEAGMELDNVHDIQRGNADDTATFRVASVLTSVYQTIDHLLKLRFQDKGRGHYEREIAQRLPDISPNSTAVATGAAAEPSDQQGLRGMKSASQAVFRVGEVVKHSKFGYHGVVLGWDIRPLGDAQTIATRWEGVVGLPRGADQPFYCILPDEASVENFLGPGSFRSSFYVAEENLQLMPLPWEEAGEASLRGDVDAAAEREQTNGSDRSSADMLLDELSASRVVEHRFLSMYFQDFDAQDGRYIGSPRLHFQFPDRPVDIEGRDTTQETSDFQIDLEELRALQKGGKEKDHTSPYNGTPDTIGRHRQGNFGVYAEDIHDELEEVESWSTASENGESETDSIEVVANQLKDVESNLKEQLANRHCRAIESIRVRRRASAEEAGKKKPGDKLKAVTTGQALAESCLFVMHGHLKRILYSCRQAAPDGLASGVDLQAGNSGLQLSHLAHLLRTATKREDAMNVESAVWMVLSAHPDFRVSGEVSRGARLTKCGYDREALRAFKTATNLDPTHSEPLNRMAAIYHRLDQREKGQELAERVLELVPGHFGALAGLSMAHEVAGKYKQSMEALRKTLDVHPWLTRGPTVLGMLQNKLESRVVEEVLTEMDARQRPKEDGVEGGAVREQNKRQSRGNASGTSTPMRRSRNKRGRRKGRAAEEKPEK